MKQSIGGAVSAMLTPREHEVLEILLHLPTIAVELESRCQFPFTWGCKRRRSAIRVTPSPSPLHHPTYGGAVAAPSYETQTPPVVKAEASSPATPLSFSPSESDEKRSLFRRNVSLKRKREHYLNIIEELTKDNNLLNGEIKNVKCYFDQLKDFNLTLKARKQELSLGPNQDGVVRQQLQVQSPGTPHFLPLIENQTAGPPQIGGSEGVAQFQVQPTTSSGVGVASSSSSALPLALGIVIDSNDNKGPIGIPDLNIPLEESMAEDSREALDVNVANKNLTRAMAAQARQKRIQIYRVKNPIANSKARYSCR